jgi:hypothetical protein
MKFKEYNEDWMSREANGNTVLSDQNVVGDKVMYTSPTYKWARIA